jgi:hypothetical protein
MPEILVVDPMELADKFGSDFVEEGTWQGATSIAEELDIEVGSEDFLELYEQVKEALGWASNFAMQVCHTSLQVINLMLMSGDFWLQVEEGESSLGAILRATETVTTASLISIATIKAGPGHGMLTNEQVGMLDKSTRVVTFLVDNDN